MRSLTSTPWIEVKKIKGDINCGMFDATLNEGERNTEGRKKSCFGFTDLNEIKFAMFIE